MGMLDGEQLQIIRSADIMLRPEHQTGTLARQE
jgi:hypothetical protein